MLAVDSWDADPVLQTNLLSSELCSGGAPEIGRDVHVLFTEGLLVPLLTVSDSVEHRLLDASSLAILDRVLDAHLHLLSFGVTDTSVLLNQSRKLQDPLDATLTDNSVDDARLLVD